MAQVITNLGTDERLHVTKTDPNKNHPIPPYFTMGRPGTSRHKIEGFDVQYIFSTLSGKSAWFFWFLARHSDYETNLCDTRKLYMTDKEKGRVPRAYAELSQKNLVVRISKGTFLINPKVILPDFSSFEKLWDKWKGACRKEGLPLNCAPHQPSRRTAQAHPSWGTRSP